MTMDIWYAFPSADPDRARETAKRWRDAGYMVACLIAIDDPRKIGVQLFVAENRPWRGYPAEMNRLLRKVLHWEDDAPIVIAGADDLHPDPDHDPQDIAAQFLDRFPDTLGIMQPTGDDYGETATICGSPWLGRAWIDRGYRGDGAFWPAYFHYYADRELHDVAQSLGLLWKRPDLTQYHDHWARRGESRPAHLRRAKERWAADRALYEQRAARGFPGHELKGTL